MVKVTKTFFIDADEGNFIVLEKGVTKKGEEIMRTYGYYPTFEGALKGIQKILIRRKVNKVDMDLKEAVEKINQITNKILSITQS